MKKILKLIVSTLFIFLVTFALCEIALRMVGYATIYFYDPIYMPCPTTSQIPFVMKPDLQNARAHGNIRINTDHLGLRSISPAATYGAKRGNEFRIAVLGDSITFGYGVQTEDTYGNVMETVLNADFPGCRTEDFNFGVSSYSVKEMAATLRYRVPAIEPDLVIVGIIYGDFDLSRTPGIDQYGYNTHNEMSGFFSRLPYLKAALRNLHTSYAIRDCISFIGSYLKKHENTDNVPSSYSYLVDIRNFAESENIPYLIVDLPSLGSDGSQFAAINEALKLDGVKYYDISPISTQYTADLFKASRFDFHPSRLVHRKIAQLLTKVVEKSYLPKDCTPAVAIGKADVPEYTKHIY